jgi:hypothetical protein
MKCRLGSCDHGGPLRALPLTSYVIPVRLFFHASSFPLQIEDNDRVSLVKVLPGKNELIPVKHSEECLEHPRNKHEKHDLSITIIIVFKRNISCTYYLENDLQSLYLLALFTVITSSCANIPY